MIKGVCVMVSRRWRGVAAGRSSCLVGFARA